MKKYFRSDVVPIVMGAPKEDYLQVAPPNSFIHVDDYESPRDLANHLNDLMQNRTEYEQFYKWKGTGSFIDTRFWCRLCSMLHGIGDHVTWYNDIENWWNGPDVCMTAKSGKWLSWKKGLK